MIRSSVARVNRFIGVRASPGADGRCDASACSPRALTQPIIRVRPSHEGRTVVGSRGGRIMERDNEVTFCVDEQASQGVPSAKLT